MSRHIPNKKTQDKVFKPGTPKQKQDIPIEKQKPVFSLHYLNKDFCLSCCTNEQKAAFADSIHRLSQLTWNEIICSHRHGLGYEKISRDSIRSGIPNHITEEVNFIAFRFCGKAPMVGYRDENVFHVIWLDRAFTLYKHN